MIERIEINLLPAEYRVRKRKITLGRETIYPALLLIVVLTALFIWTMSLDNRINQMNNDMTRIEREIQANKHIQDEINALRKDKNIIQEKIHSLERITVNREKWVKLMETLCERLPEYTWLITIEEKGGGAPSLRLDARTFSFPEVANFMSSLQESEYISGVDLSDIEQIAAGAEKAFRFGLTCRLNPNAKIKVEESDESGAQPAGYTVGSGDRVGAGTSRAVQSAKTAATKSSGGDKDE